MGRQLELPLPVKQDIPELPKAGAFEKMLREYRTMGMHPDGHVMAYIRDTLGSKVLPSNQVLYVPHGTRITVAGLVIRRQRPLAKALFITLEDEYGHIPMTVWPKNYARLRNDLKAPFLVATGTIFRQDKIHSIIVEQIKPIYVIPDPPESRNFQ
jgi:error-prone DNA polymerase